MVLGLIFVMLILSSLGVIGFIVGPRLEKEKFNNGICKRCGNKLVNFDMDSLGARGYTCEKCGYTTWVSYNRVDRDYWED